MGGKKFRDPCGCGKAATFRIETSEAIYYRCDDCAKKMLTIRRREPVLSPEHKKTIIDILTDRQLMLDDSYVLTQEEKIHAIMYIETVIKEVNKL